MRRLLSHDGYWAGVGAVLLLLRAIGGGMFTCAGAHLYLYRGGDDAATANRKMKSVLPA